MARPVDSKRAFEVVPTGIYLLEYDASLLALGYDYRHLLTGCCVNYEQVSKRAQDLLRSKERLRRIRIVLVFLTVR